MKHHARVCALFIGACLIGGPVGLAQSPLTPLRTAVYVSGLSRPVEFVQDPSDSAVQYVVEQGGRVRLVRNGVLESTDVLDMSTQISSGSERGLLGLAFAPDYASSRRFFVNFTTHGPVLGSDRQVTRF